MKKLVNSTALLGLITFLAALKFAVQLNCFVVQLHYFAVQLIGFTVLMIS